MTRVGEAGQNFFPMFLQHLLQKISDTVWFWPESKSKRHQFVQLHWTFFDILHGEHQSGVTHDGSYAPRCGTGWAYRVHISDRRSHANDRWTNADCNSLANVHGGLPPLEVEAAGWCGAQKSVHAASYLNLKLVSTAYLSERVCWMHFVMHHSSLVLKNTAQASAACWLISTTANPPSPPREGREYL